MQCLTYNQFDKRIVIIPLDHSKKEDILFLEIPKIFEDCDNLNIYWEAINRYENTHNSKKLGLEDNKLLSFFEIILFIIVNKDPRLHEDVYEGTGIKDDYFKNVSISQNASNAARGTQAVLNLRDLYKILSNCQEFKEDCNLKEYLETFNIDKLINQRNNDKYLDHYNNKLVHLYYILLTNLKSDNEYNYIDFDFIKIRLNDISDNFSFFDSRFNATDLKEYIKDIRDISNSIYIINNMIKYKVSNSICCIGGAHVESIRKYLIKYDSKVNVVDVLSDIKSNMIKSEIYKIIKDKLNVYLG